MKKFFWYLFKIFVSISLLWWLFQRVDLGKLWIEIYNVGIFYFVLSLLIWTISWVVSSFKWKELLGFFCFKQNIWKLFLYNMVAIFYNIVLPGGKVAGDTIRAYQVARDHEGDKETKKKIALIVLLDRGFLLFVFFVFTTLYVLVSPEKISFLPNLEIIRFFSGTILVCGIVAIFSPVFDFILPKFLKSIAWTLRSNKAGVFKVLGVSAISVILSTFSIYVLNIGLEIPLGFWTLVFFNSITVMLTLIPITIAGIGLREGGLVYLFTQSGIAFPKALALSALNLLLMLFLATVGGIFEFYYHFLKRK